jgi:hypothetical protein
MLNLDCMIATHIHDRGGIFKQVQYLVLKGTHARDFMVRFSQFFGIIH